MNCAFGRRNRGVIKPIQTHKVKERSGDDILEELEEPLSPGSTIFHRPTFNVHVLAIMGCKTTINVEVLKAKLPLTLLKQYPRFSSLVVGDLSKGEELRWVRTEVDVDKHIVVPHIDPKNIVSPDKFVEDYMYNLSKTTLDKSRPLWDIHILQVKTSEEAEAIGILRLHHSLGDGSSLISLLLALMQQTSDPKAVPTIPVQKIRQNNNKSNGFFWKWILSLWWVLTLSWNTIVDVAMFLATSMFLKDDSPMGPPEAFTPRRVVYRMVSLDDMKLVKNAMSATINDVALGITQAGLSLYLSRKSADEAHKTREEMNRFLKRLRLRSLLLINLRPSGGIQALADLMEKNTEARWGNAIGFVLLPFTLGLQDDPLEYIRLAKASVDRKKHSLEALYTYSISEIVMNFLGTKVASLLSQKINSHTTLAFSNLVGPLEEISFYGHPLAFLAPTSYGQPQGLMINFQSCVNKMAIVLSVDENMVPDPRQLCDDIEESLKCIKDAVLAQGLVDKPMDVNTHTKLS